MALDTFLPQNRYIPDYLKASHESLQMAANQANKLADSGKTTTTKTETPGQQGAGLGAGIGGAIGTIAGSYFGPAGSMVGGMLGGAIGGAIDGGGVGAAEGGAQGLGMGAAAGNSDAFESFKLGKPSADTMNAANQTGNVVSSITGGKTSGGGLGGGINLQTNGYKPNDSLYSNVNVKNMTSNFGKNLFSGMTLF